MSTTIPTLTEADVVALASRSLQPATPGRGSVALEIEWIIVDSSDRSRPVRCDEVMSAAAGELPCGGLLSIEPGGQLELTTARHDGAREALAAADADEAALANRLAASGLRMLATGLDLYRPPLRLLDLPRYRAMEGSWEAAGLDGRLATNSTASIQVNLDFGQEPLVTWERAGLVAPVLAAAFANSPHRADDGSWRASARWSVMAAFDPSRTRPVPTGSVQAWADYALDALVFVISDGTDVLPVDPPFSLRRWVKEGHRFGYPDAEDVAVHLTTLFPPVRPRGWLECRFLDALPSRDREVAVLTVAALIGDDAPIADLRAAVDMDSDPWVLAPFGTTDRDMRHAVKRCLELAITVLDTPSDGASAPLRAWVDRRRAAGWAIPAGAEDVAAADLQSVVPLEQEIH